MNFTEMLQSYTGKPLADCTNQELYLALLEIVRHKSADKVQPVTGRKLYYISAEFLIGKLLSNNLINLGLYDDARAALAAAGKSLSEIEEVEPEPSLGNGGLGRLAACFLDSLATLGLPGDGVGLRYHFGLFRQSFENGLQNEKPDPWLTAHSWAEKTDITYPVQLAGKEYTARLYKLAVTGYGGPPSARVPAVPDGFRRCAADPCRVRRTRLRLPRSGGLRSHSDQRYPPEHGHP